MTSGLHSRHLPARAPPQCPTPPTKPDYRSTVFLPQDRLSDEGRPAAEGAGDPRAVAGAGPLRPGAQGPRGAREVHPPRRPALRQRRHPHRPRAQPHAQGHGRAHPDPARQGRALRARLGLPRPADRVEDRGAVPQEEARQGRGAAARVPRRVPRLCAALGRRPARAVEAARHRRRLGQSLSDDGLRRRGDDRRRADEVRRERPALPRRQAGDVVAGREDRAGRGRDRI